MDLIRKLKLYGDTLKIKLTQKQCNELREIIDKELHIKITKHYSKRTLQQNKFIWVLIDQLDEKINGHKKDEMSIYINLIDMARVKTEYLIAPKKSMKNLLKVYRYVEILGERELVNGKKGMLYRCYYGTSTFNKKEMADFINCLLDYCHEYDINTEEYERYLR